MTAAVLAAGLIAAVVGFNLFLKANPANVAAALRRAGAWAIIAAAAFLALRGQFALAGPLVVLGLIMLGKSGSLATILSGGGSRASRSEGQKSRVRTEVLAMELDHDTGSMDGEVLLGDFAGRELSSLDPDELIALYRYCAASDPQSSSLMEAYLDRNRPEWREAEGVSGDGHETAHGSASTMTREEALEILGLAYGATREEIRKAHKALMKRFHPDHGGSSYIASKINQAKDLLLE